MRIKDTDRQSQVLANDPNWLDLTRVIGDHNCLLIILLETV